MPRNHMKGAARFVSTRILRALLHSASQIVTLLLQNGETNVQVELWVRNQAFQKDFVLERVLNTMSERSDWRGTQKAYFAWRARVPLGGQYCSMPPKDS